MKFNVRGVREAGELDKERVVIDLLEDGNTGTLIVASTTQQSANSVSARISSPYWVPDQDVKKGDLLVIYTKKGSRNSKENTDGTTSYFFYMGRTEALYVGSDQTVAVFDIASWKFAKREGVVE
jgi:hypothetical protein